jgi:hypothetical protein
MHTIKVVLERKNALESGPHPLRNGHVVGLRQSGQPNGAGTHYNAIVQEEYRKSSKSVAAVSRAVYKAKLHGAAAGTERLYGRAADIARPAREDLQQAQNDGADSMRRKPDDSSSMLGKLGAF